MESEQNNQNEWVRFKKRMDGERKEGKSKLSVKNTSYIPRINRHCQCLSPKGFLRPSFIHSFIRKRDVTQEMINANRTQKLFEILHCQFRLIRQSDPYLRWALLLPSVGVTFLNFIFEIKFNIDRIFIHGKHSYLFSRVSHKKYMLSKWVTLSWYSPILPSAWMHHQDYLIRLYFNSSCLVS